MSELVLKSYKKKDVDAFLLELNAEHLRVRTEKDDEIKRLHSECEHFREECAARDARIAEMGSSHRAELETKQRELDAINARIGEKISAAEKAASDIVAQANGESAAIHEKAVSDAGSYVADAKKRADDMLAEVEKVSRACIEGQRHAEQIIRMLNKQLDDLAAGINDIVKE